MEAGCLTDLVRLGVMAGYGTLHGTDHSIIRRVRWWSSPAADACLAGLAGRGRSGSAAGKEYHWHVLERFAFFSRGRSRCRDGSGRACWKTAATRSPVVPGSPVTVTYTLPSVPAVTEAGFFNPLTRGSGGFAAGGDNSGVDGAE